MADAGRKSISGAQDPVAGMLAGMPGAEAEFARRVQRGQLRAFIDFALSNRSRSARSVLARAASDGALGMTELAPLLKLARDPCHRPLIVELAGTLDRRTMLGLASLIANQRLDDSDVADALTIYNLVAEAHGPKRFGRLERMQYLELLSESRLPDEFDATFSRVPLGTEDWQQAVLLAANLVNPWSPNNDSGDVTQWRRLVQHLHRVEGVEPIDIVPSSSPAFDNILCSSLFTVTRPPMVTVLVPTHNPGRRLGTALASTVNQTWKNLEILVLDDGSDEYHHWHMAAWAERDPRIRILRIPENIGNYAARNLGLTEAAGDLVTIHDDDDWSHPRKIEAQVNQLLESPTTLANMSQMVRATGSLEFTRINKNPNYIQPNYSSLMFRRKEVLDVIGYWHELNRDADAEFRHRLAADTGTPPPVVGSAPLSFLRVRSGSLTSGEIYRGYIDPRRRWYQLSSAGWREDAVASGATLHLPRGSEERRFSVPQSMLGAGRAGTITADIVYATDFRFPGGNTTLSANELETLLDSGYAVCLMQIDSPVLSPHRPIAGRIRQLATHPNCTIVTPLDDVYADVLLVRHPTVMQMINPVRSRITARRAVLIVNHPPALRDGSVPHYDIDVCVDNFRAVFGQDPIIAPESGVIRACLEAIVDRDLLNPFDWHGTLPPDSCSPRAASPRRPPVIGRHSRDSPQKWPSRLADLVAAYPTDGSRDVRVLGGADGALAVAGGQPLRGWTVHPFGAMTPQAFLKRIDFWVYFHADPWIESFGMSIAEAAASGAVVILPHYMEATFGPAALYCEPDEVQGIVDAIWTHPQHFARQSAMGIDVVASHFSRARFLNRVRQLIED
jgi:hypothetical protein